MTPSILDDPQHWRERAVEARRVADKLDNPIAKAAMLRIVLPATTGRSPNKRSCEPLAPAVPEAQAMKMTRLILKRASASRSAGRRIGSSSRTQARRR